MAVVRRFLKPNYVGQPTLIDAMNTGVTKSDGTKPLVSFYEEVGDSVERLTHITLNTIIIAEGGAAAKAFGQKVLTFPKGLIRPKWAQIGLTIVTAATTATAGEIGLGGTIASGATAVLSGTAGFNNFMYGTTLSDITTTATAIVKANTMGRDGAAVSATHPGPRLLDGSATAIDLYLNIASTWGAAENCTLSNIDIRVAWEYVGKGV